MVVVNRSPKAANVTQVSLQNPAIVKLPTKGASGEGDDEGDDD